MKYEIMNYTGVIPKGGKKKKINKTKRKKQRKDKTKRRKARYQD